MLKKKQARYINLRSKYVPKFKSQAKVRKDFNEEESISHLEEKAVQQSVMKQPSSLTYKKISLFKKTQKK